MLPENLLRCVCTCPRKQAVLQVISRTHTKSASLPTCDDVDSQTVTPTSWITSRIQRTLTGEEKSSVVAENNTATPSAGRCPFRFDDENVIVGGIRETPVSTCKPASAIPGPVSPPCPIGNLIKYTKLGPYRLEKILDNRFAYLKKYGKIYSEKLGLMDMIHIFDPSDVATMFRQEGEYPSRGHIPNLEKTYLERNNKLTGFAFLDGPEWARQRQIIQKAMMHPTAATRYLHMQIPVVNDFVAYLRQQRNEDGLVPDLNNDLFKYTMEAIGVVCFDERLGTFESSHAASTDAKELTEAIQETFYCMRECMFRVPFYKWFRTPIYRRFEKASNKMREIMGRHVQRVREKVKENGGEGGSEQGLCPFTLELLKEDRSMFEVLMQDDRVTTELAVNLIMALFRTGIDSTGNALAFFLYNLARNPDKQQTLYDEINSVIGTEALSIEAIARMPYLKASLKESFRLNFPVYGGSGRVLPTDVVMSGYRVPKGKFIYANMAAMGLMEQYFPEPERFVPERWLRDDRATLQTTWPKDAGFISLPFSAGMRACPGKRFAEQALYLATVTILQNFRLEHHGPNVGMLHMPFTMPDKPLNIEFHQRDASQSHVTTNDASTRYTVAAM